MSPCAYICMSVCMHVVCVCGLAAFCVWKRAMISIWRACTVRYVTTVMYLSAYLRDYNFCLISDFLHKLCIYIIFDKIFQ